MATKKRNTDPIASVGEYISNPLGGTGTGIAARSASDSYHKEYPEREETTYKRIKAKTVVPQHLKGKTFGEHAAKNVQESYTDFINSFNAYTSNYKTDYDNDEDIKVASVGSAFMAGKLRDKGQKLMDYAKMYPSLFTAPEGYDNGSQYIQSLVANALDTVDRMDKSYEKMPEYIREKKATEQNAAYASADIDALRSQLDEEKADYKKAQEIQRTLDTFKDKSYATDEYLKRDIEEQKKYLHGYDSFENFGNAISEKEKFLKNAEAYKNAVSAREAQKAEQERMANFDYEAAKVQRDDEKSDYEEATRIEDSISALQSYSSGQIPEEEVTRLIARDRERQKKYLHGYDSFDDFKSAWLSREKDMFTYDRNKVLNDAEQLKSAEDYGAVVAEAKAEAEQKNAERGSLAGFLGSTAEHSLSPCITRTGYYVNSTAAYDSGSDYTAYTFRVNSGDKLRISGAYVNGNSKAVTLSSDGQLIGEFWTTTYSKAQTFDYTVGENVAFIRFTGFTNKGVSVEVMDSIAGLSDVATNKTKYNNSIGNFESAEVYLDYLDLSRGYLSFSDGVTVKEPTGAYYYTRYIAVHDNRTIVLNNAYGTEGVAFHCYDSEKNWKGYVDAGTFKYNRITNGQFKIPIGTAFIRFMVHVSNIKNYSMRYTEDFNKWYWADGIITDFMNATKWKVTKLFKKATQKPILTLIDDDTPTVASTKLYHDSCVANGVVGCYAVITQQLLSQSALATQLKAYEKDGFQNLFHCHSQIAAYDTSSESYNITTAEADFVQGAQEMQTFGFANWRYWCSPYGSCNEALAGLAKKWGMKCLVRSGLSDYETTIPKNLGKYQISRISLNQNDEALQTVKTALDNAATDNGWVLVTTHMGETGWDGETSQQRFTDMITYAKSKGFEIKTLGEAFEIRRPIYELYETF